MTDSRICRRFVEKSIVVTGAASGIGLATSVRLAQEGAKLVLVDLNEKGLAAAKQRIELKKKEITTVAGSVSDPSVIEEAVYAATTWSGKIDGIVNNAGIVGDLQPFCSSTDQDYEQLLEVNLKGVLLGMRTALGPMISQGSGAIVNTASIAATRNIPLFNLYGMTKGAVMSLTRSVACEVGNKGIRVNCVSPGVIETAIADDLARRLGKEEAAKRHEITLRHIPLRRRGQPDEVASAIAFLLSDDAAYITGIELPVEGGYLSQ